MASLARVALPTALPADSPESGGGERQGDVVNLIEQSYGKLQEGMHVTGYTFERACSQLLWLIEEDRWKKCGNGFTDINEFLDSVRIDDFKLVAEKRKKLAAMIKALEPNASNRQIAKTLGVGKDTVNRDLGANAPCGLQNLNENNGGNGANAPPTLTGQEAAKLALRRAAKVVADKESAAEQEQRLSTPTRSLDDVGLFNCDFENAPIEAGSIDFIITDPPYPEEFIDLYAGLAKTSARWLKPGGSLLAMAGQAHLPRVLAALSSSTLIYRWTIAYLTPGGQSVQIFPRRVNTFWKPIFWFVNGEPDDEHWIGDVTRSNPNDNDKRFHNWGQSESGFADLIERFTQPGDLICDPFMGGGTTGAVALALGRNFIGVEKDIQAFELAKRRLAA